MAKTKPMFRSLAISRFAAILVFTALASGCALSLRNPNVSDLRANPGRYHDRSVNIDGVVVTSWGLPLLPFRFYKVDDGTGEVTVLSTGSRTPARGSRVHVKGRVNELAVIGGQPIGLHLQEEKLQLRH